MNNRTWHINKSCSSVFGQGIDLGWYNHMQPQLTFADLGCANVPQKLSGITTSCWLDEIKCKLWWQRFQGPWIFQATWLLGSFFLDVWIFGGAQERHVRVEPNDAGLGSRDTLIWGGRGFFVWLPLWQMEGEILKKYTSTLVTSGKKRWDEWLVSSTSESKVEYMSPWHHVDGLYVYRYLWNSTQVTCQSMAASPQPAGSKWSQLLVWLMAGLCGELQYPCSWHVRLPGSEAGGGGKCLYHWLALAEVELEEAQV